MKTFIGPEISSGTPSFNSGHDDAKRLLKKARQPYRTTLSRAQDQFIALSSHQLRTPATCVKQYLGMVLDGYAGEVPDAVLEFIRIAYSNNEKQLDILSVLLKIATINSGQYHLAIQTSDICDVLQEVIKEFSPPLQQLHQHLAYTPPDSCNLPVDSAVITTAIGNLIDNASHYSPSGSTIRLKAEHSKSFVVVSVQDEGIGIRTTDIPKIFKKFTRLDNEFSDTVNGNGLGLYLAKQIVELHGGSIAVTSKLHCGSTFSVFLPLRK